jgi:hypothetical protein
MSVCICGVVHAGETGDEVVIPHGLTPLMVQGHSNTEGVKMPVHFAAPLSTTDFP